MNANDIAPNLYEEWGLDRRDGAHELLVLLESKDLQFQQQGQEAEEPRRAQLRIAASVLGSARKRAEYDNACAAGLRPTWGDLGQLGAVGQWNPAAAATAAAGSVFPVRSGRGARAPS
ncbi:hypothetical protein RAE03_00460 [Corynebacterium tuberculostearicum]|uniref:Uncharacterized protein n=1 Tax=Corynebacterium tuberculostearicum TaxID=38304 RepID=A0AAE4NIL9_9CORY|nr:hypothetical protein [Corynebacterium tuberculostearicum]MDV2418255.1 hypothetical protein [Corynebacterium tuberculostearicum]